MNILSFIKDGLIMGKDKIVSSIVGIGSALKYGKNRAVLGGLSAGLIISGHIKLPQAN